MRSIKPIIQEPAVECVAKFININYGHNKELMDSCKRLHDYSYFINCIRSYLHKGNGQKEAVVYAMNECIQQDILKDIFEKHRAEVVDMFLTTFDKKMYERAVREEAREAGFEEGRLAGLEAGRLDGRLEGKLEGRLEGQLSERTLLAKRLKENGIPYETARKIVSELNEDDLKKIYEE